MMDLLTSATLPKQRHRTREESKPAITVQGRGALTLNRGAMALLGLGEPDAVRLAVGIDTEFQDCYVVPHPDGHIFKRQGNGKEWKLSHKALSARMLVVMQHADAYRVRLRLAGQPSDLNGVPGWAILSRAVLSKKTLSEMAAQTKPKP